MTDCKRPPILPYDIKTLTTRVGDVNPRCIPAQNFFVINRGRQNIIHQLFEERSIIGHRISSEEIVLGCMTEGVGQVASIKGVPEILRDGFALRLSLAGEQAIRTSVALDQ